MPPFTSKATGTPTDDIEAEVEDMELRGVKEVLAVARPSDIDTFYVEHEMDQRAAEQPKLWEASGEAAARPPTMTAGELAEPVKDIEAELKRQKKVTRRTRKETRLAEKALRRWVRRAAKAARLFYARMGVIFAGDIAGTAAATILFGLEREMAYLQAVSLGGAALAAGTIGSEWRDLQQARDRQKEPTKLTKAEKAFERFFSGPRAGERYAKIALGGGLFIVALIAGGIFALQAETDSPLAGVMFGCLSAAIGLASFANYYSYADEVADFLDSQNEVLAKETAKLEALRDHQLRRTYHRADTEAASIRAEHAARGEAARLHMLALKYKVLRISTGVTGHGYGTKKPAPPVGVTNGKLEQLAGGNGVH